MFEPLQNEPNAGGEMIVATHTSGLPEGFIGAGNRVDLDLHGDDT